ncbi:Splicing factor-like protein, partial [Trema orientale]
MDVSLSTPHYSNNAISFSAAKHHSTAAKPTNFLPLSLKSPPPPASSDNSTNSSPLSGQLRRPKTLKTTPPSAKSAPKKIPSNPLKTLVSPNRVPTSNSENSHSVTKKLWLTSKLSPPPPPPPPPPMPAPSPPEAVDESEEEEDEENGGEENSDSPRVEFRQEGKIFVGNLPSWIKKNDVSEFFRQFGPIKNVILIKAHENTERNAGFGFVLYAGTTAAKSAMKAVEFDGVEFHGRVLTVKLDDGRRLKGKMEERARWVHGYDGVEYRSKWHEEREGSRMEFKKVVETEPENWKAV